MEPIRPERDEVRSSTASGKAEKPKQQKTAKAAPAASVAVTRTSRSGGSTPVLLVLLIAAVAAGGWGWFSQKQKIDQMSETLKEADYWARQSKLALARFEGQLSETGESLQEKDSSLSDLRKQVKTADSEIRKLWAVANERNKEAINANKAALAYLEETTSTMKNDFKQQAESLQAEVKSLKAESEARTATLEKLESTLADLQPRLADVEKLASEMSATVDQRLDRFAREQDLARQELVARIDSLEGSTGSVDAVKNELAKTRKRLSTVEGAIDAIDAARAQLNSRLIRLDEEVTRLRKGG